MIDVTVVLNNNKESLFNSVDEEKFWEESDYYPSAKYLVIRTLSNLMGVIELEIVHLIPIENVKKVIVRKTY